MNVTLFHYFLFSFEKTRLPAYCLKPTPQDCAVVRSVFRPLLPPLTDISQPGLAPVMGKVTVPCQGWEKGPAWHAQG